MRTDAKFITLNDVMALSNVMVEEAKKHSDAVANAAIIKAKLDYIQQTLLPNAMRELQMTEFTLATGETVILKQVISASVSEFNMPAAEEFLKKHGLEGIIKHQIIAEFGKDENEEAAKALKALQEAGIDGVIDKKNIHAMTLKATINEQLKNGVHFPTEPFSLFITDAVDLKGGAKAKTKK